MSLKNLFFTSETPAPTPHPVGHPGAAPVALAPAPVNPSWAAAPIPTTFTAPDPAVEASIGEKLVAALEEAKSHRPGVDFIDFRKAMDSCAAMGILDEPTRFKAAYATLMAQGISVEVLTTSMAIYLNVLEEKEAGFKAHIEEERITKVKAISDQADQLKQQATSKAEQIGKLTQEIADLNRQEYETRQQATQAGMEIDTYQATFTKVKGQFLQNIQGIGDKITYYLGTSATTPVPPAH